MFHMNGTPIITIFLILIYFILFILDKALLKGKLFMWGCEKSFDNMPKKEWYRIVTGSFFHANALHLSANIFAVYFVGILLENKIGSVCFLSVYLIWNLAASLIQAAFTKYSGGCGASPGIYALIACILLLHIHDPNLLNLHFGTWSLDYIVCYFFLGNLYGYNALIVHTLGFSFGIIVSTILVLLVF